MCITIYGSNNIQHTMAQDNKPKITFADLDNFLKIAPIIGLAILAYLQTLFPSKTEFKEIQTQLIQMDKKITEMTVLQKAITSNTADLKQIDQRLRVLELEVARHNAQKDDVK
jgi:predicted nuclease with TOPRIM domain